MNNMGETSNNNSTLEKEVSTNIDDLFEKSHLKVLDFMKTQNENSKQADNFFIRGLNTVIQQNEIDNEILAETEKQMQEMATACLDMLKQQSTAMQVIPEYLKEYQSSFKKQSEDIEEANRNDMDSLAKILAEHKSDIKKKILQKSKSEGYRMMDTLFKSVLTEDSDD